MNPDSLCATCYNAWTRKWEKEPEQDAVYTRVECSIFSPRNVTRHIVLECNKYEERKLTREQFIDKAKEGGKDGNG